MKQEYHFWFSKMQKDIVRMNDLYMGRKPSSMFAYIDGTRTEYTVCSKTEERGCNFKDLTYLGKGTIADINEEQPSD